MTITEFMCGAHKFHSSPWMQNRERDDDDGDEIENYFAFSPGQNFSQKWLCRSFEWWFVVHT